MSNEYDENAKLDVEYEEISPLMQSIVDQIAENPDKTHTKIAGELDCDGTYPGKVKRKFPHLIDERRGIDVGETQSPSSKRYEYGEDAMLNRTYDSLKLKQRSVVDALIALGPGATKQEVADRAGVSDSYIGYVEDRFPHIINDRRGAKQHAVADGGEQQYDITLSESKVWQCIRTLDEELSQEFYDQIKQ